jgi:hypothetical protein
MRVHDAGLFDVFAGPIRTGMEMDAKIGVLRVDSGVQRPARCGIGHPGSS